MDAYRANRQAIPLLEIMKKLIIYVCMFRGVVGLKIGGFYHLAGLLLKCKISVYVHFTRCHTRSDLFSQPFTSVLCLSIMEPPS